MSAPHMPMMNGEGLLECPFCGDIDGVSVSQRLIGNSVYDFVLCWNCGAETGSHLNKKIAEKLWNTRNGHLYTAEDFNQAAQERG